MLMNYDRRFIPEGKGEYILNGAKSPLKNKPLKRGLNITQKSFLKNTGGFNKNRFIDHDGDGVISGMDCFPFDKSRHDSWNPFTGNYFQKKEIPDIMRDGLHHSLDITRVKGKYSDPAKGPSIDTKPLVKEMRSRYKMKRQMLKQTKAPPILDEESQLGFGSSQYGV